MLKGHKKVKHINDACNSVETCTPMPRNETLWSAFQYQLREDANTAEGVKVVFFGDGITEMWRGTCMGRPHSRNEGIPEIWDELFKPMPALALAICGDRTEHLLWRIEKGGELPAALQPRVIVLAIGTSNFLCFSNLHCMLFYLFLSLEIMN